MTSKSISIFVSLPKENLKHCAKVAFRIHRETGNTVILATTVIYMHTKVFIWFIEIMIVFTLISTIFKKEYDIANNGNNLNIFNPNLNKCR